MPSKVIGETRIASKVNQNTAPTPWIDQVPPAPHEVTGSRVSRHREAQQAIAFYSIQCWVILVQDIDVVRPRRDSYANPSTCFKIVQWSEVVIEILDQGYASRTANWPHLIAGKPLRKSKCAVSASHCRPVVGLECPSRQLVRRRLSEPSISLSHDRRALRSTTQDRNSRVCRNGCLKNIDITHTQHGIDTVALSDEFPQRRTVLVTHPAIGADESQPPTRFERPQSTLVEADVHVYPSRHRRPSRSIRSTKTFVNIIEPNIRRVSHDHVEVGSHAFGDQIRISLGRQQVVTVTDPTLGQHIRRAIRHPESQQHGNHRFPAPLDVG
ncbi:hypothetical protein LX90_001368 [Lentzea flava]|nr:hypothetical protein [Lentzea flava]